MWEEIKEIIVESGRVGKIIIWSSLLLIILVTTLLIDCRSIKSHSKQERIEARGIVEDKRTTYKQ